MPNKSHSQTKQQKLPNQRWLIHSEQPEVTQQLATNFKILPLIAQALINRDISSIEDEKINFHYFKPLGFLRNAAQTARGY